MKTAALRWLYRIIERKPASEALALIFRAALACGATRRVDGLLSAFERRFVLSGWPDGGELRINLHMSRLLARVRRAIRRAPTPKPAQVRAPGDRLRVGLIGRFSGLLGFPPSLFAGCPPGIELTVFDAPFRGQTAGYLATLPLTYHPVALDGPVEAIEQTASTVNHSGLDLLINVNAKADAHTLLDIIDTGCVANYCSGSDLLHHPRVDVEMLWQMPGGYDLRDGQLFCQRTGVAVRGSPIHQIRGFYDARDLGGEVPRPWQARRPLIVSHGSLYKFAVPLFCSSMLDVLEAVDGSEWVLFGKDNGTALRTILGEASARGLSDRVRYEGEFSAVRDDAGSFSDPGWARLKELLRAARLAPDPFPIGSGSARFEAYMLGTPSVHMGPDARAGHRPLNSAELPLLSVAMATATGLAAYRDLSIRCLTDQAFGESLQQQQLTVARRATDAGEWWRIVSGIHRQWAAERGCA